MNRQKLSQFDPEIFSIIEKERKRQEEGLEMIPSENFVSPAVLEALGSILTNKYSEGYIGNRYYGGCEFIDKIEQLAIDRAKQLFGAEHVNVQPLSGAPANIAVYLALLKPGETILGMDLSHGGHLTHGSPVTHMADLFHFIRYKTNAQGLIDYDELRDMAREHKPKLILVGYSAYSREIDYEKIRTIAEETGSITMADVAHIAGLIAAGEMNNPVPIFDVVTTTTHKTLRGPRGGMIMCREKWSKVIDKSVFPGFQGGPHEHNISAKAVAFKEALQPDFKIYARQVMKNAKVLEEELKKRNYTICFGQTDNHLLLVNLANRGITVREAQNALDKAGITVNKNMIPDDPRSPVNPSGIRLGTPALTTRGMQEEEMRMIAGWLDKVIANSSNETILAGVKNEIVEFCRKFPLYA
jgi:glycine hydroxymethyltransferase